MTVPTGNANVLLRLTFYFEGGERLCGTATSRGPVFHLSNGRRMNMEHWWIGNF